MEQLKKVRKAGVSVAYGEVTPGVVGIAAPVFDAGRSPVASICVTIAGNLVDGAAIERIAADVQGDGAERVGVAVARAGRK